MIRWNFPGNQDGQIKGVADAGIENFNGTELSSLARENCQNSLDAAIDEENPEVLVEFNRSFIKANQIPGIDEYRTLLRKCKQFWDKSNSDKAKQFLKDAVTKAEDDSGFVLRISDYNTTGLSDPYNSSDDSFSFDGWNALIKIDGGANKGDDKAGAFGIGKSAPFSNSHYRLVFYRTYNQDNEKAAQGISRLLSYKEGSFITSGVGYYGDPRKNDPVKIIPELDELNIRDKTGTDVFIYGFKAASDWDKEIINALLDNFLISVYKGYIRVRVQDQEINAKTIGDHIIRAYKNSPGEMKGTYGNYLSLTRKEGVSLFSKDFHGMGTLELRVLVDPNEKLDRKVLVVRKAGMKLFRLGNISKLVPFTGILELKGKKLNNYFREMETVAHDNWEPGRHSNPKQARAYYVEIKDWIRETVSGLAEYSGDDEMDVEGLSGILQKEPEQDEKGETDNKKENLNDHLGSIDVIERSRKSETKGLFYGQGDSGSHESEKTNGTLGPGGEPGLRVLKGKRRRKKLEKHSGRPDAAGKDIVVEKKPGGETNCPLKNVRIIKNGAGKLTLAFEIPHDVESGRIELVTVGENGKSNRINIADSKPKEGCNAAFVNGEFIETTKMLASSRVKIDVTLVDTRDYAMEINVYEHHK